MNQIPTKQWAVQLVGPDQLILNKAKDVFTPGQYQILCQVEAVGLCFSDLKLLKQFSSHVRKGPIVSGIDPEVLEQIPSYVPGQAPTVPGHEVVVRIAAVGEKVENYAPGQRYLVQTDYRWLHTASSNAAFGYNFEGALQQYVLMDLRVVTSPEGQSMLLPVGEDFSGSAIALVEPWACVEDAYACEERRCINSDGRMLVVCDKPVTGEQLQQLFTRYGRPKQLMWVSSVSAPDLSPVPTRHVSDLGQLDEAAYDDVVYFGADPVVVEALFARLATAGLLNIVLCGARLGREIVMPVGRVHYGSIRIIGTEGCDPAESMATIPATGEIRPGDKIQVVGAGGPMGMMHVIRNICQGVEGVSVFASDLDAERLATLSRVAEPLAKTNGITYSAYDPTREQPAEAFDYIALMAPVPQLVAQAVQQAAEGAIINIFAGIPATVTAQIDLDSYLRKRLYFIGTSGSTLEDMQRMLQKVQVGQLDTNVSVAAISGLAGAVDGIRAVEKRQVAGKIIVYPQCRELPLLGLEQLSQHLPAVHACLKDGLWTAEAERTLLAHCASCQQ